MHEALDNRPSTNEPIDASAAAQPRSLTDALTFVAPNRALASRVLFNAHADAFLRGLADMQAWDGLASPSEAEDPGLITLDSIAGSLHVAIDLAAYPALQIVAHASASATANKLRNAIASALLAPLLDQIALARIGAWRVTAIERGAGSERIANVALTWHGRRHQVGISAPESTLAMFAQRVDALTREAGDHGHEACTRFGSLPLPGRVTIGKRSVPIAALQRLEPGDVLLRVLTPATAAALQSGDDIGFRAHARWGTPGMTRLAAAVCIEGLTLTITEEPFMTDQLEQADDDQTPLDHDFPDQHDEDAAADQSGATDDRDDTLSDDMRTLPIGELELPLQFEIDTVAMPLAQLAALRPGYVIELRTPVKDARIRLVAHGQTIGHGELVSLGEHLGIRILQMAHGDGSIQ
ncbi:type III secretion system cytoplasmic ring protein SctQ [Paraburkholderia sp. ZP32-5]|uniref:type III secretion system cytoplasmic ring protein SctQ n=1 Tax=Paraburkholderia sp. ZP32-5 TaxID=2883245 RepID=UPI001F3119A8|nr:type III secretion system cytoplasmic ring protein SctQ [Paraburkholderia sp. ZP32-5]